MDARPVTFDVGPGQHQAAEADAHPDPRAMDMTGGGPREERS
jgi:hypothetical protein